MRMRDLRYVHDATLATEFFRLLGCSEHRELVIQDADLRSTISELPILASWSIARTIPNAPIRLIVDPINASEVLEATSGDFDVVAIGNQDEPFTNTGASRPIASMPRPRPGIHPYSYQIVPGGALGDLVWSSIDPDTAPVAGVRALCSTNRFLQVVLRGGTGLLLIISNAWLEERQITAEIIEDMARRVEAEHMAQLVETVSRSALHLDLLRDENERLQGEIERSNRARRLLTDQSFDQISPSREAELGGRPKLSIVIVGYNMQSELNRTIISCTAPYQVGVASSDIEVVVVDNGSDVPFRLSKTTNDSSLVKVLRFEAGGSLSHAVNQGVAASSGEAVAVMVDGAHLLSPGVVYWALKALSHASEAVVAFQRFFLGEEQQTDSSQGRFDRTAQDELLERIDWQGDGYGLFDVSVFTGDRSTTWLSELFETNFLVMLRWVFDDLGGADERFNDPAGGLLNLHLFTEATERTGSTYVLIIGEATFHQFHNGTTTNTNRVERDQKVARYKAEYQRIFERPWSASVREPLVLGHLHRGARLARPFSDHYTTVLRQFESRTLTEIIANANAGKF